MIKSFYHFSTREVQIAFQMDIVQYLNKFVRTSND